MANEPICSALVASLEHEYERSRHFLEQLERTLQSGARPPAGASDTLDHADVDDEKDRSPDASAEVEHKQVPEKQGLKKKLANLFRRKSASSKRAFGATTSALEDVTARISVFNMDATFEETPAPPESSKRAASFGHNALLPTSALYRSSRRTSCSLRQHPLQSLQQDVKSGINTTFAAHWESLDMPQHAISRSSLEIIPLTRTASTGQTNSITAPYLIPRALQSPLQTASPSSSLSPATTTLPLISPTPISTKALASPGADIRPYSLSSATNPVYVTFEDSAADLRGGSFEGHNCFSNAGATRPPAVCLDRAGGGSVFSPRTSQALLGAQLPPPLSSLRARSSNQIGYASPASPLGGGMSEHRRLMAARFSANRATEYDGEEEEVVDDGVRGLGRERLLKGNTFRGTMRLV